MGQKYRLLLAAMLAMDPELLMLDEPSAQLDPEGLDRLRAVIRSLKSRGLAVLIAEHRTDLLAEEAEACYVLANGRLEPGGRLRREPWPKREPPAAKPPRSDSPVLEAEGLAQSFPSGDWIWDNVSLRLEPGERAILVGPNGSGKSSLLRCLCGLSRPAKGAVRVLGKAPYPRQLCGRVGYLQQSPQRQLFETTLYGEVEFTLKRLGWSMEEREARVESVLDLCGLSGLARQSPFRLSFGQQHLAALAALFAPKPSLLLLDDPFAGLDRQTEQGMVQLLEELSRQCSTAVVYAGHNHLEPFPWAHSRYRLKGGELIKESAPAQRTEDRRV
jgi:energy-coupling factor transport system ATP-binding protein